MTRGNKVIIDCLLHDYKASLYELMGNDISVMHCAAQTYVGFMSILILREEYKFPVNQKDAYQGTPLHFAVINGVMNSV